MQTNQRDQLRSLFQYRCGYCAVSEADVGSELTVDHFQPRSEGGADEPQNWVYCCHACNEFKGQFWKPTSLKRILHPLRDSISEHIEELQDATLRGRSETGVFHIERMHLNRPQLVAHRLERRRLENARQQQIRLLQRLQQLENEVQILAALLEQQSNG